MTGKLMLAVPSKGRLMDQALDVLGRAGLEVRKTGNSRGYRGELVGQPDVGPAEERGGRTEARHVDNVEPGLLDQAGTEGVITAGGG